MHAGERFAQMTGVLLGAGLWLLGSCGDESLVTPAPDYPQRYHAAAVRVLPSGTRIAVKLTSALSTGTAHVGDSWRGVVATDVVAPGGGVIPAGSPVEGVVAGVTRAKPGSRAMLALSTQRIRVDGRDHDMTANASPVIAAFTPQSRAPSSTDFANATGDAGPLGPPDARRDASPSASVRVPLTSDPALVLPGGAVMGFTLSQAMTVR